MQTRKILKSLLAITLAYCCISQAQGQNDTSSSKLTERRIAILNHLRNEINATYGFIRGIPRINMGPCGPFAKAFREQWNARFNEKINIVFMMNIGSNPQVCCHILVRLPDGSYFDGGNGVVTDSVLLLQFASSTIEEMKKFDINRLEKYAYGLNRKYRLCPNYSNDLTTRLIVKYLSILAEAGK